MFVIRFLKSLSLTFFFLAGCASYSPHPITVKVIQENLNNIKIISQKLKHPVLKPVTIDLEDGLSPDEVAIIAVITSPKLQTIRNQKGIAVAQLLQAELLPNPEFSLDVNKPVGGEQEDKSTGYSWEASWALSSLLSRKDRIAVAMSNAATIEQDDVPVAPCGSACSLPDIPQCAIT